ncbi:MAG: FixH family protein [Robiginitomaculum sp.]|nr:FixH family protein [Robiginitomaculum sp.]MDQ7078298.1 FixH family protein [Robiginitomaculum sp.]
MKKTPYRVKGWHVLAGMIIFFGIIIGVNTIFIIKATGTFPGMSVSHPFQKGIHYNQTIEAREIARAEGWKAHFIIENDEAILVTIQNDKGPVDGLSVSVHLFWPGLPHEDRNLKLLPSGPGQYRAALDASQFPSRTMEFEGVAIRKDNQWGFPFKGRL